MYDLIVIGAGPAGLAAMAYARIQHRNALLIGDVVGGKVDWLERRATSSASPVYGTELVKPLINQLSQEIDRVILDSIQEVRLAQHSFEVVTLENGALSARALIVATGTQPVTLGMPGALHLVDRGLYYSLVSHASAAEERSVAIVGATPRILRGAVNLARSAEHIFIVAPHPLKAPAVIVKELRQRHNVEILENATVVNVLGEDTVRELIVDGQGQQRHLAIEAVFVDLGLRPNSGIVAPLLATDPAGFIIVDHRGATTVPGIFAAGDVTTTMAEQIATALGDGTRAAQSADDYLEGNA